jgi:hypothetical protein
MVVTAIVVLSAVVFLLLVRVVSRVKHGAAGGGGTSLLHTTRLPSRHNNNATSLDLPHPLDKSFFRYSESAPICSTNESNAPPLDAKDVDYTLVTQLSSDRLWMMEHHCQRWGHDHPISVAIFTNETLDVVLDRLVGEFSCHTAQLTVQVLDSNTYPVDEYPVNVLRNMALRGIHTSHVVYVDVDFWTSEHMYETLMTDYIRQELAYDYQLALVLPAFSLFRQCVDYIDCRENNFRWFPFSFSDLYVMLKHKRGFIFDPTNKGGHGSTKYKDWLQQKPGSLVDIDCLVSKRYEPFLVVRYCHELPPFQEGFTGYGKNKMTWAMQLIREGYGLSQVGGAYLCHYPHLESESRLSWNQAPQELQMPNKKKNDNSHDNHHHQQQQQQQQYDNNKHHSSHSSPESDGEETNSSSSSTHAIIRKGAPTFRLLRPQQAKGPVDFKDFKRGQVDELFVQFREWLQTEIPDQTQIPLCDAATDDDAKLWIDRDRDRDQNRNAGGTAGVVLDSQ